MGRRVVLSFVLLVGLLVGLTLEPDSGTAASLGRPDVTGATVGANHAKPLPRILTVDDVAQAAVLSLVAFVALAMVLQGGTVLQAPREVAPRPSPERGRVPALRGPPARSAG